MENKDKIKNCFYVYPNEEYLASQTKEYKLGYNNAIDDFVNLAKEHDFKHDKKDITNCVIGFIEFFAEQLKAGENDEMEK